MATIGCLSQLQAAGPPCLFSPSLPSPTLPHSPLPPSLPSPTLPHSALPPSLPSPILLVASQTSPWQPSGDYPTCDFTDLCPSFPQPSDRAPLPPASAPRPLRASPRSPHTHPPPTSFTDDSLATIGHLSHLQVLDLCGMKHLTDTGLEGIARCTHLVSLNLSCLHGIRGHSCGHKRGHRGGHTCPLCLLSRPLHFLTALSALPSPVYTA
ncbi:unnamed protein product [Closterium sp. NIES-64]|nr:unnamed protein product [Closterium sp. NIES-64]